MGIFKIPNIKVHRKGNQGVDQSQIIVFNKELVIRFPNIDTLYNMGTWNSIYIMEQAAQFSILYPPCNIFYINWPQNNASHYNGKPKALKKSLHLNGNPGLQHLYLSNPLLIGAHQCSNLHEETTGFLLVGFVPQNNWLTCLCTNVTMNWILSKEINKSVILVQRGNTK